MTLQGLREGNFLIRESPQLLGAVKLLEISLGASPQPLRQIRPGRIFPSQNAGPARRANMTGRVGIIKSHAFLRQTVDIRSFVKGASVATDIAPPKIINQKENNVRFLVLLGAQSHGS